VVSTPQSPLPTIPAGYLLTIFLNNDSFGNVIKATFIVIDDQGNIAPPQTVDVAPHSAGDIAPVAYGQLVLVGMDNGETALLSSGAGMITYSSLGGFEFISQDPTGLGGTLERQQHLRLAADRPPISVCAIVPVLAKRSGIAKTWAESGPTRRLDGLPTDPGRRAHEEVAGDEIRPVALHAVIGDMFGDPFQRVRQSASILVCPNTAFGWTSALSFRFLISTHRSSIERACTAPSLPPPIVWSSSPPRNSFSCGGKL
jgi:hypothetical protein